MVCCTNRLSVGEGWFEVVSGEADLFALNHEVYEAWIETGFLSD